MDSSEDSSGFQSDTNPNNMSIPPSPRASCSLPNHQDTPSASALPSEDSSFPPPPPDPPPSFLFPHVGDTEGRTSCRPASWGKSHTTDLGEATQEKVHRFSRELSCSSFMPPWCLRRGYGTFPPGEGSGLPETILFKLVPPHISGVNTLHAGGAGGGGPAHKKRQHLHSRDVLDCCILLDFMFLDLRSYQERRKILRNFVLQPALGLSIQRDLRSRHGQGRNVQTQSSFSPLSLSPSEKRQRQEEEKTSSYAEGDPNIGLNSLGPSHGSPSDFSSGVSASQRTPSQLYVQRGLESCETEQAVRVPGEIPKVSDTAGEELKTRHTAEGQDAVVDGEENERGKEEEDRSGSLSTSVDLRESASEVEMNKRKTSAGLQNEEGEHQQQLGGNKEIPEGRGGRDIDSSREEESQVSGSNHSKKPEKKRDPGKPTSKSSGGGSSSSGLSAKGFGFQCFCVNTAGDTLVAACGNFLHIYHVPTKVLHASIRLPSPSTSASSASCCSSLLSSQHTYEKDRQPPEVHPLPPVKFLQFFDEDRLLLVATGCGHVYIYFMLQAPQPALLSYFNISEVYVHSMDRLPYLAGLPPLEKDDLPSFTASSPPQSPSQLNDTDRQTAHMGEGGEHTKESNSPSSFHHQGSHVFLTGIEPLEISYPPCIALGAQRCTDTWRIATALAESVEKEDEEKGRSKSFAFPRIISTPEDTSCYNPFFLDSLDNELSKQSLSPSLLLSSNACSVSSTTRRSRTGNPSPSFVSSTSQSSSPSPSSSSSSLHRKLNRLIDPSPGQLTLVVTCVKKEKRHRRHPLMRGIMKRKEEREGLIGTRTGFGGGLRGCEARFPFAVFRVSMPPVESKSRITPSIDISSRDTTSRLQGELTRQEERRCEREDSSKKESSLPDHREESTLLNVIAVACPDGYVILIDWKARAQQMRSLREPQKAKGVYTPCCQCDIPSLKETVTMKETSHQQQNENIPVENPRITPPIEEKDSPSIQVKRRELSVLQTIEDDKGIEAKNLPLASRDGDDGGDTLDTHSLLNKETLHEKRRTQAEAGEGGDEEGKELSLLSEGGELVVLGATMLGASAAMAKELKVRDDGEALLLRCTDRMVVARLIYPWTCSLPERKTFVKVYREQEREQRHAFLLQQQKQQVQLSHRLAAKNSSAGGAGGNSDKVDGIHGKKSSEEEVAEDEDSKANKDTEMKEEGKGGDEVIEKAEEEENAAQSFQENGSLSSGVKRKRDDISGASFQGASNRLPNQEEGSGCSYSPMVEENRTGGSPPTALKEDTDGKEVMMPHEKQKEKEGKGKADNQNTSLEKESVEPHQADSPREQVASSRSPSVPPSLRSSSKERDDRRRNLEGEEEAEVEEEQESTSESSGSGSCSEEDEEEDEEGEVIVKDDGDVLILLQFIHMDCVQRETYTACALASGSSPHRHLSAFSVDRNGLASLYFVDMTSVIAVESKVLILEASKLSPFKQIHWISEVNMTSLAGATRGGDRRAREERRLRKEDGVDVIQGHPETTQVISRREILGVKKTDLTPTGLPTALVPSEARPHHSPLYTDNVLLARNAEKSPALSSSLSPSHSLNHLNRKHPEECQLAHVSPVFPSAPQRHVRKRSRKKEKLFRQRRWWAEPQADPQGSSSSLCYPYGLRGPGGGGVRDSSGGCLIALERKWGTLFFFYPKLKKVWWLLLPDFQRLDRNREEIETPDEFDKDSSKLPPWLRRKPSKELWLKMMSPLSNGGMIGTAKGGKKESSDEQTMKRRKLSCQDIHAKTVDSGDLVKNGDMHQTIDTEEQEGQQGKKEDKEYQGITGEREFPCRDQEDRHKTFAIKNSPIEHSRRSRGPGFSLCPPRASASFLPSLLMCEPTALLPPPSYPFYLLGTRSNGHRDGQYVSKPFPDRPDARLDIGRAIITAADAYEVARAAIVRSALEGPRVDDEISCPVTGSDLIRGSRQKVVQKAIELLKAADLAAEEAVATAVYWCDIEKGGHSPWAHPVAEELVQHVSSRTRVVAGEEEEKLRDPARFMFTHHGSGGAAETPPGLDEPDFWGRRCEWVASYSGGKPRGAQTGDNPGVPLKRKQFSQATDSKNGGGDRLSSGCGHLREMARYDLPRIYRDAIRKSRQTYCLVASQRDCAWENYALASSSCSNCFTV
ncbi:hypothetical protein CSUI_002665 [Cystoisospora suis]|uniref:Uncharacterized protein n=1 Tax=Cystoisospora suis TaxID=483139 RepID=A0A2C6L8J1_9APIC|nr:hypothetical protein CSUI_002665 [Cystoisospora suis]